MLSVTPSVVTSPLTFPARMSSTRRYVTHSPHWPPTDNSVDVVHLVRPVLSPNLYRSARGLYHCFDV
jgi:hypothetical protein